MLSSEQNTWSHPVLCSTPPRWYQWGPGLQRQPGQMSRPSPSGLARTETPTVLSFPPFPQLSISVPPLLPLYFLKAKCTPQCQPPTRLPLPLNSPRCMLQILFASHSPSPPGHTTQHLPEKTSAFGHGQRRGGCPHRLVF